MFFSNNKKLDGCKKLSWFCLYFRNVYEILTQNEGANQYEACLMKGNANFFRYFGDNNFQTFSPLVSFYYYLNKINVVQ